MWGTLALASALTFASAEASAQTVFKSGGGVSSSPPGRGSAQAVPSTAPQAARADLPVSKEVIEQAREQIDGEFPPMLRSSVGGQLQQVWDDTDPDEGVTVLRWCADCVYKVRTREFMITTVILPPEVQVASADLGDSAGFQVKMKGPNMLAVRPTAYGVDTNLNITTKSGAVYPFYLRAEAFNSKNVPDLVVKILGREPLPPIEGAQAIGADPAAALQGDDKGKEAGDKVAAAVDALKPPADAGGDFVRTIKFDPSKLHGWNDYKLWGEEDLKPEVVFRDDIFTYLQYGKKFDSVELPTAYVVRDGIDELVNTRVEGTTYIIESTADLITLKNGKTYLCIQYTGETP